MISEYLINYMQQAVEAAQTSHHPDSKVGAALVCGKSVVVRPNGWPAAIENRMGKIAKIGNASATVHAETACLLAAESATENGAIFSTDPSCPNCAKNMAEAGIRHLYIDHKGFEKYYAQKRLVDFENLTLHICKIAGISVTRVFRKEQRTETILSVPNDFTSPKPAQKSPHFASCKIKDDIHELKVYGGPVLGLETETETEESKYNLEMQPINRLLMSAARKGLKLDLETLYSSRIPTARELVNALGAGVQTLKIGDVKEARDAESAETLGFLSKNGILNVQQ